MFVTFKRNKIVKAVGDSSSGLLAATVLITKDWWAAAECICLTVCNNTWFF